VRRSTSTISSALPAAETSPLAAGAAGEGRKEDPDLDLIRKRLSGVARKVLVLSGKGGVGKSTMTAQLAFALAARGLRVGLLDVDICGPSIPHMLGLRGQQVHQSASGWSPVYVSQEGLGEQEDDDVELGVMSIGFMLPNEDDAVIWRGPRKNGLIKQFLTDVEWGELDFLLIDTPPGVSAPPAATSCARRPHPQTPRALHGPRARPRRRPTSTSRWCST